MTVAKRGARDLFALSREGRGKPSLVVAEHVQSQ